jgi:hypothetical protein
MSKRLRPSLKDYLRTGEVRVETMPEAKAPPAKETVPDRADAFLALLSEADRRMWEPVLSAGTEICSLPLDLSALREEFLALDRTRFTFYVLVEKNAPLRPVRTDAQIREPLVLLFRWDERGTLTLYGESLPGNAAAIPRTASHVPAILKG